MKKVFLKWRLLYNIGIMVIVAFVYVAAFLPFGAPLGDSMPVFYGSTGQKNIALQIAVDDGSDIAAYMDVLEAYGVCGTFFLDTLWLDDGIDAASIIRGRGHDIGWYKSGQATDMYIGGGYSLPVMSYDQGSETKHVCPSIDMTTLTKQDDWADVLDNSLDNDLFLYVHANNDFTQFEKIVQIVLDKGYTILKINEML